MESNLRFKDASYWDQRFCKEGNFEWVSEWENFGNLLLPYMKPTDRILHVGCGTSELSMKLYALGFHNITNLDFSSVLIEKRSQIYPEMNWICDDMRTLQKLPDDSFDVVIEKASIESLLVAEKSPWKPSEEALLVVDAVFDAIRRVLVTGGLFFSISFTHPHFRVPLILRKPTWSCSVEVFGQFFHFFCYRMQKGANPDWKSLDKYLRVTKEYLVDSFADEEERPINPLELFKDAFDEDF